MKPEIRERREAAVQARGEGDPTTFSPKLHKEAPWDATRTFRLPRDILKFQGKHSNIDICQTQCKPLA